MVVNPNNPSGKIYPTKDILEWSKNNPDKFFLIDESFIEYSEENSIIEELEKNPLENVIVLKVYKSYVSRY